MKPNRASRPVFVTVLYPPGVILTKMDIPVAATISSFIIRFVVDTDSDKYRGEIRHIQTREELQFTDWQSAVEFIQRYIPIAIEKEE